jgi:hypothetical protein
MLIHIRFEANGSDTGSQAKSPLDERLGRRSSDIATTAMPRLRGRLVYVPSAYASRER